MVAALAGCGGDGEEAAGLPGVQVGTPRPSASATPRAGQPAASPDATPPASREPRLVSLAWLDSGADPPALPAHVAGPLPDDALLARILDTLAGATGEHSVVVHNLIDGRYAGVNQEHVYYAASLFKLGVLYEAYRQRDSGEIDLSRVVTLEEEYAANDLGTLSSLDLRADDTLSLQDALRVMVIVSDTPTAVLLQETLGGSRIDATLRGLGLADTEFYNPELPATARDMARLLEALAVGERVSADSRRDMLSLLIQESYREGVVAGVPSGTAVAHKTGSYAVATHDAALVWAPAGPYLIVVMSDQANDWPLTSRVSATVWDYFAQSP
jgi:beta-lactamase class A